MCVANYFNYFNSDQKAAHYNDGFVNFPEQTYKLLDHYIKNWRPAASSESERVVLKLNGNVLDSNDFSKIMNRRFFARDRKEFCFTSFRKQVQTVFAYTESDETRNKWFNKIMVHRLILFFLVCLEVFISLFLVMK